MLTTSGIRHGDSRCFSARTPRRSQSGSPASSPTTLLQWAEDENDDDHSFHITASRHWKCYIDIMVFDSVKEEIVDTAHDRFEKERQRDAEEVRKFEESLRAI